jgi:hypothetical protein
MADPTVVAPSRKLGKLAPKHDRRTLLFPGYLEKRKLPVIPPEVVRSLETLKFFPDLGMMRNGGPGGLSDCTSAAKAHMEQTFTVFGGKPWRPTDDEIVADYNLVNGGVDEGAAMLDALKVWRSVGIGGRKILAFTSVNPLDHLQVKTAHYLLGGLYVGANLPISCLSQDVWDVGEGSEFAPGSLGGHAISSPDYSDVGSSHDGLTLVTWGKLQRATWAWVDRYVDEMYGVLSVDYVGSDDVSPEGFSMEKLADDLKAL